MNWSKKQGIKSHSALLAVFFMKFAIFTLFCVKAPILPRALRFPLPSIVSTIFWLRHCHIRRSISPAISQTRPLKFLLKFLFPPNLMIYPMPHLITLPLAVAPFHAKSNIQLLS
jgi:hypothetical protein